MFITRAAVYAIIFISLPAQAVPQTLADTVERVLDGVVNIRTRDKNSEDNSTQPRSIEKYFGFILGSGNNAAQNSHSSGSGFFYRSRKWVVTNFHVVKDSKDIVIATSRKHSPIRARILGFDERSDLAVLMVVDDSQTGPILRFGSSSKLRLGDLVFAIGNPFGYGHSVTSGILSAKDRTIGAGPFNDFLQTDAPINPGNSGGPLFNLKGEVVGINTAIAPEARGISFAIPSEAAQTVIDGIIASGSFRRPWIGALASNISEDADGATRNFGVFINKVLEKSPAEAAGLQPGDIILGANGTQVREIADFQAILNKIKPQETVSISIFRNKSTLKLQFKVSEFQPGQATRGNLNEY
jgi:serine protease Do